MLFRSLELVKALRQVVVMPKVEYQHFDGDPLKYATFFHNFTTYLDKDNSDDSQRLQLIFSSSTAGVKQGMRLKAALTCLLLRVTE